MSKRSHSVCLLLMAASPLILTACTQQPPPIPSEQSYASEAQAVAPKAYQDVQSCVNDGKNLNDCEAGFATAQSEREQNAPRFASKEECEQQYEACGPNEVNPTTPQSAGGGFFMPLMVGYMMGNMMNNNQGLGSSLYRTKGGEVSRLNYSGSQAQMQPARAATQARGGFGRSAAGRSSGG